jgi:plastocyanin
VRIRLPALGKPAATPTLLLTVPLVALAAACGSSGGSSGAATTPQAGSSPTSTASPSELTSGKHDVAGLPANLHGMKDVTGMTSVEIEADDFYFQPTILKGSPGQHLMITIKNTASTEHNFTIKSEHINKDLSEGKSETVSVTFPSSGTLSFFCEYHKSLAMAGGLQAS